MNKRITLLLSLLLCALLCLPALAEEAPAAEATAAPEAAAEAPAGETAAAPQENAAALSENLYDFQLELCGSVITLPMKVGDFAALGWQSKEDLTQVRLEPNQYSTTNVFTKDGAEVYVAVMNSSMEVKPMSECMVGEISMDSFQAQKGGTIRLARGIEFGASSREDVEAAYGAPSSVYEGSMYYKMSYEYDSYQDVEIQIDNETKVVSSVAVRNFVDPNPEVAQASEEPPQSVKDYQAPAELGSDMMSFNVEYAGNLYHLPAPLAAFEANGWTLKAGGDEAVPARGTARLEIIKDNQTLRVWLYNDSDGVSYARNCFVTGVKAGMYDTDVAITLPGGLNRESTMEEVEAAFKDWPDGKSESGDYIYFNAGESLQEITVCVNRETRQIQSIEVQYMP